MRKSSARTPNYRAGFSRGHLHLASFREQMSDYAKGEVFRDLRAAKRMSQEAVAFELGVSTKTVRAWEKSGGIRWDNAQAVGKFYGRAPESLVTRDLEEAAGLPSRDQLDRIEQAIADNQRLLQEARSERRRIEGLLKEQGGLLKKIQGFVDQDVKLRDEMAQAVESMRDGLAASAPDVPPPATPRPAESPQEVPGSREQTRQERP